MTDFKKQPDPYKKNHVKKLPGETEAEVDREFRNENSYATEDYSAKGDVELSDSEYLRRARALQSGSALPEAPAIPGFHTCWAVHKSNNSYDTIDHRQRLGYALVKPEEVPSYASPSNRGGEFDGCVSHNELVLMKIPTRYYHILMKDVHHDQPMDQERAIKQNIVQMHDNDGNEIVRDLPEMTGINNLARKVKEPTFT